MAKGGFRGGGYGGMGGMNQANSIARVIDSWVKLPPLVVVLSISAIYLGMFVCIVWC